MVKFNYSHLTPTQKELRKRILDISFSRNLAHIGSCLNSIDLIYTVYATRGKKDLFVLSNGHAGIAYYSVLEKFKILKKKSIAEKLYFHPDRNKKNGISVSSGSLGQGLPIALGMAISDKKKNVYCLISDGESAEGSIWEALRIGSQYNVHNLKIIITANGWGAYSQISQNSLKKRLSGFGWKIIDIKNPTIQNIEKAFKSFKKQIPTIVYARTTSEQFSFLQGQDAHYYVMTKNDYQKAKELLQ